MQQSLSERGFTGVHLAKGHNDYRVQGTHVRNSLSAERQVYTPKPTEAPLVCGYMHAGCPLPRRPHACMQGVLP